MTSLFLALVLQSQPLSLDALAPLSQLAVHLKKDHQIQLTFPPVLEDQVVFVKFNQVQTDEAMKRLAAALDCKSTYREGKWLLEQDQELFAQRKAEEKAERKKDWEARLKALATHVNQDFGQVLAGLRSFDPEDQTLSYKTPPGRFLIRLMTAIGAEKLAEQEPHTITSFSTLPGSQNQALPGQASQFAAKYDLEREQLRLAKDQLGPAVSGHYLFSDSPGRAASTRKTSQFALTAFSWFNQRTHLFIYDDRGAQITYQAEFLPGKWSIEPDFIGTDAAIKPSDSASVISPLDYSWERTATEAKAIWQLMKDEPLDFIVRPFLNNLAENHGLKVAMAVPDSAHSVLVSAKPKTEKALCQALARTGIQLKVQDGWLTSRLKDQSQLGKLNLNRQSIKDFAAKWDAKGVAWLRAMVVFAARNSESARRTNLDEWLMQNAAGPMRGGYLFPPLLELETKRAMGAMTDQEWEGFLSGRPIPIPLGTRLAHELVMTTHGREFLERVDGGLISDQMKNGAFAFAAGPPSSLHLVGLLKSVPALKADSLGRNAEYLFRAAQSVANTVTQPTETEVESALGGPVTIGVSQTLQVRTLYGSPFRHDQTQEIDNFLPAGEPKAFKDWPKDFKEDFMSLVKEKFGKRRDRTVTQPPR